MPDLELRGAFTALVTPFTTAGKIDTKALEQLVSFQIAEGIDGLVPCGSTGEASTLTDTEYDLVVRTVVKEAKGRVPVIAGAGSNNTEKAVRLSLIAKAAGADGLLHVSPYYNKPTVSGLQAHFKTIADATDMPMILYNIPGRTGQNIAPATIVQLSKSIPQVIGVKEASGNIVQMMDIVKHAPQSFALLAGDDAITLPVIAIGGVGVISATANEIPKQFAEMVHAALENNWDRARQLHYQWLELMQANFIETNPIPIKTALALMGKITGSLRLPLVPMEPQNRTKLEGVLKRTGLIA